MFAIPPATQALIIVNVLVFLITGPHPPDALALWTFGPGSQFQPWQLISYAFLHGGWAHLFFNMLALYMFGSDIERLWGTRRYLVYYFGCVLSAAIVQLAVSTVMGWGAYKVVGASGGVFGVLLAFGMMFPRRMVMLLLPPIPMRAWVLVLVYGAIELFMGITGTQSGVAHFAHLGGMAGGFLLIQYWRGRLPIRPSRR
jgi:membrane associated rhomboid family serine protease